MDHTPDNATPLRIGVPKGSLQESTINLFERAGYKIRTQSRSYFPTIDDLRFELVMFRAQEMSRYVEDGVIDMGITGYDWIVENQSDVHEVCELTYSKSTSQPARWVLAVPEESGVTSPADLAGGIIATELVNATRKYFGDQNIPIKKVEFSWGATEVKARLVDAIVDITETGSSLRANNLRVIDTILTSTTRLIVNHRAWEDQAKRHIIEDLALLLNGAIAARAKVGLKMNVPRDNLDRVLSLLACGAIAHGQLLGLMTDGWRLKWFVEDRVERDLVPQLVRTGATGIISYSLNKVIH